MPGANYMGGKRSVSSPQSNPYRLKTIHCRNAMRARAKDTVGRQQKGHFGRQRLDLLSKGLAASKPSERSNSPPFPTITKQEPPNISLAHARHKTHADESTVVRRYIPSPVHISPITTRSRRRLRGMDVHTSSSRGSRSEVLDKLDTTERK